MFGIFGKSKKETPDKSQPEGDQDVIFSSPAATALAAAASSNVKARAVGPVPTGRALPSTDVSIDLDNLRPKESIAELQVQPITLLKYDYKLEHSQQVAISNTFICYGLKAGHIRALNRNTADRALFKGHPGSVSYMAFFNPATNLLASAAQGDLAVRQLAELPGKEGADGSIEGALLLSAQLPAPPAGAAAAPVALAWHPLVPQILAVSTGDGVCIYEVPMEAPEGGAAPAPASPGIRYSTPGGAAVTSVAFSPSGDLLVAGDASGAVHAWWLEGDDEAPDGAPLLTLHPFEGGGSGDVRFLHQGPDGSSVLLTGDAPNSRIKLWGLPPAAAAAAQRPRCLQSVAFTGSKEGSGAFFCHLALQPELQLVVLANTARKQVYTLHYSLGPTSSSAVLGTRFDYAAFFSVKQPILSLAAILEAPEPSGAGLSSPQAQQPQAGQQLLLYCVQTDAIQQYTLNTGLCLPGSEVQDEEEEEVEGAGAAAGQAAAAAREAPPAPSAAAGDSGAAAAAAAAISSSSSSAAQEAVSSPAPDAAAVPPAAKLPTPTFLGARVKAAHKGAADEAGSAGSSAAKHKAQDEQQQQEAVSADGSASTDSDITAAREAAVESVRDAAAAAAVTHLPPMPTTNLMHSAEKAAAASPASTDAAAGDGGSSPPVLPAVPAATAAAAAAGGGGDVAALQQQMQQMLVLQQQIAAQLQGSSQQTVAGVKAEVSRALKGTEASLLKQIDAAIKASAKKLEEDRRKGATKERQELEKLFVQQLAQTSTQLQHDLTRAIGDAAREQGRNMVNAIVTSVTPVVASAVASSMQQELGAAAGPGGALQAALEGTLSASLARPLHEALKANFDASLIPAFERATQAMFHQVEGAFNNWMSESSAAVAATQAEAASSLSNSLAQLQALVGTMRTDLADTSRSLSRMASRVPSQTGGAAAAGGSGGGGAGGGAASRPDPRVEVGALLAAAQYEQALVKALNTASLDTLLWACKQMDPAQVLGGSTCSLTQTTLLSLVQQLSSGLANNADLPLKLAWLGEAGPVIDPHDPLTAPHIQGVLGGVLNALKPLVLSLPQSEPMAKKGKLTLHLFNSLLHQ